MSINIVGSKGDKKDPAFRYKMPALMGKVEGRGNGIKTVIVNAADIAMSLHRPTSHFTKFFGCELGAQSKYDVKHDKAIVNGSHETRDMQQLVDRYCDLFVLCPGCNLPETSLKIKSSKKEIWHVCKACGAKSMVDMTHKLCTFILKEAKAKKARKKKDKNKDKTKKKKKSKKGDAAAGEEEGSAPKEEKKKSRSKKSKSKKKEVTEEDGMKNEDENGITWYTDFSDDAVKTRKVAEMAKLAAKEREATDADLDQTQEPEEILAEQVGRLKRGMAGGWSDTKVKVEVINLQMAGGLEKWERLRIVFNAVLGDEKGPADFVAAIEKNKALFASMMEQLKNGPAHLLMCILHFFTLPEKEALSALVAVFIQTFYDIELLTEAHIRKWWGDTLDDKDAALMSIKAKTQPLIDWLDESDSEEEEEEGEDE